VDATSLPAERVGVGHYVTGLIGALGRSGDVELHAIAKRRDAAELRELGAVVHEASPRTRPERLVWEQTVLPMRVRRIGPRVFHGPHYTLPRTLGCPAVVTFHDPTFFTLPEVHERAKVAYFRLMAVQGAKRAARVIAVSEYARRGAVEHTGVDAGRVDVVHLGVDLQRFRPEQDPRDEKLRARVGISGPFLFWVGAHEPRKDVPTLVEAFAALVRAGADHSLVLAGPRAWGASAVDDAVERSGVAARIVRPGFVSEDEKTALYRGAAAFVYPSIAEGFGLQVLEAMACGCPVVTTTGSAPEEIGADAVAAIQPRDAAALRAAIESILADPGRADEMRRRGLQRAATFTWDRTAAGTVEAYRRAAG
jgi:glycosyltransferase involved in cell wall biosynthesis